MFLKYRFYKVHPIIIGLLPCFRLYSSSDRVGEFVFFFRFFCKKIYDINNYNQLIISNINYIIINFI